MWKTPIGDRVLIGVEREFYIELILYSIDRIDEIIQRDDPPLTGDRIFDSATSQQKIILMSNVLKALLDPSIETPKHQNINEAAAYYPFVVLRESVEDEIENEQLSGSDEEENKYYWRELIWKMFVAYCQAEWEKADDDNDDEDGLIRSPHSIQFQLFQFIIEDLEERLFWDMDWKASSHNPQILDGVEPEIEAMMGYGSDYFTTKLPKGTEGEVKAAIDFLRNLQR